MTTALVENVLLALVLLIGLARFLGEIFERIGMDSVVGELLAGLILGPSIFNILSPNTVESFAVVGAVLILFLAGLKEENATAIFKDRKSLVIGLSMLFATMAFITLYLFTKKFTTPQILFLALAYGVVDLGVPAKILLSKNLLNTKPGQTTLNSAVINVFSGLTILTILTLFFTPTIQTIALKIGGILLFIALFLILYFLITNLSKYIIMLRVEEAQFSIAFVMVLLMAYLTEILGFSNILGAFLAGIVISRTNFVGTQAFAEKIKAVSFGIFVPLFFAWFGLGLDLSLMVKFFGTALIFFAISSVVKFITSYLIAKSSKIPTPGLLASSMLSLDVESLVILLLAVKIGIFSNTQFSPLNVFAPSVLLTTILVIILVNIFLKIEGKKIKLSPI